MAENKNVFLKKKKLQNKNNFRMYKIKKLKNTYVFIFCHNFDSSVQYSNKYSMLFTIISF